MLNTLVGLAMKCKVEVMLAGLCGDLARLYYVSKISGVSERHLSVRVG